MYAWKGYKLIRINIRVFFIKWTLKWPGYRYIIQGIYLTYTCICAQLSMNLMYIGKVTEKGTVLCLK